MSCKNYLLLIGILNTVTMSYNDFGFVTRIGKFEEDMEKCFREHENHFGIDENNSPKLPFDQLKANFSSFYDIFMFISNTVKKEAGDGYKNEPKLEEELYKHAVWIYLVGSDNNGVKYHNFCHGMFVAYITYEFLTDKTTLKDKPLTIAEGEKAMYVFAGLFHDAGHPGLGNGIYDIDKNHRENMIDHVCTRITKILPAVELVQAPAINNIKALKKKSYGEKKFLLEDMHKELALMTYKTLILPRIRKNIHVKEFSKKGNIINSEEPVNPNYEKIISNSIDRTNMGFSFDNDTEYILFRLNHAADIALNGMRDNKLVFLGIEKVYNEFFTEIYHMIRLEDEEGAKIKTFIQAGENGDDTKLPGSVKQFVPTAMPSSFNQIFKKQVGFCNFLILPHIEDFNSYQADIFTYIKDNLKNNVAIFQGKIDNADGKELGTITANVMQQIKDEKEINDPAIVSKLPYSRPSNASVSKAVTKILLI